MLVWAFRAANAATGPADCCSMLLAIRSKIRGRSKMKRRRSWAMPATTWKHQHRQASSFDDTRTLFLQNPTCVLGCVGMLGFTTVRSAKLGVIC